MKRMWDLILILVILTAGVLTQIGIVCAVGIFLTVVYVLFNVLGRYLLRREIRRRHSPVKIKELLDECTRKMYSTGEVLVRYFMLACISVVLCYDTRVLMGGWVLFVGLLALLEILLDAVYRATLRKRILRRLETVTRQFEKAGLLRAGPHNFEVKHEVRV